MRYCCFFFFLGGLSAFSALAFAALCSAQRASFARIACNLRSSGVIAMRFLVAFLAFFALEAFFFALVRLPSARASSLFSSSVIPLVSSLARFVKPVWMVDITS